MRTPLTYYGGKQRLADQICALFPPHQVYLEPFCGGAAILFGKEPAPRETINDLDGTVIAFWRMVRDRPEELARAVSLTPYSREEWKACWDGLDDETIDDLERARRLITSIDQSYSREGSSWSPPSLLADRRGRWQAGTWMNVPDKIAVAAGRLQGVAVENRDALEMLPRWDETGSLIYCDPPYTGEHRINQENTRGYRYDNTAELWPELVTAVLSLEAASVLISGYPCEESQQLEEAGWARVPIRARRTSRTRRGVAGDLSEESVWVNPVAIGRGAQQRFEVLS